jgi:hypothetical protein
MIDFAKEHFPHLAKSAGDDLWAASFAMEFYRQAAGAVMAVLPQSGVQHCKTCVWWNGKTKPPQKGRRICALRNIDHTPLGGMSSPYEIYTGSKFGRIRHKHRPCPTQQYSEAEVDKLAEVDNLKAVAKAAQEFANGFAGSMPDNPETLFCVRLYIRMIAALKDAGYGAD